MPSSRLPRVTGPRHAVAAALELAERELPRRKAPPSASPLPVLLVAVDGRTGAGKSSLARELLPALSAMTGPAGRVALVEVEAHVPGWSGLAEGVARCAAALTALDRGRTALVESWDWATMSPGRPRALRPTGVLLLEGCGALAAAAGPWRSLRCVRILVEAPRDLRHKRVRSRDHYDWDVAAWERQEHEVARAWRGRAGAGPDLVVRHGA